MLTNEKLELIHYRAMVGGMRESMQQHPLSDFKTWAADMSAAGWFYVPESFPYAAVWQNGKDSMTVEEAIALYADGETPNKKRLVGVAS